MHHLRRGATLALLFLTVSAGAIQNPARGASPSQSNSARDKRGSGTQGQGSAKPGDPDLKWLQEILGDRELMEEIGNLGQKMQKEVHYPASRNESRILPRLPESTVFYGAYPNYGETLHQAMQIFDEQLTQSPHLKAFLAKNHLDAMEPQIAEFVQKFYELSQFLGDEVVVEGQWQGGEPSGVLVAEVKKPGLKEFLEKLNAEWITSKADRLLILDPQQLAAADADIRRPAVLIRPDLLAISFDVANLRAFNSQIDQAGARFISGRLGKRVAQAYDGGTNSVLGVDLHKIIASLPHMKAQDRMMLEKSGLADADYLLLQNSTSAKGSKNDFEVIFQRPRRGIASWIAEASPMGGLDFVSANSASAVDVILKNPAEIYDDLEDILGVNAFAGIRQMETQLNLSLKHDLLGKLGGEIAFETKVPFMSTTGSSQTTFAQTGLAAPKTPAIKFILKVNDAAALQQTLAQLLTTAPLQAGDREEDGVTFHTLTPPTQSGTPVEINYFFLDGYLVIASDRATARDALDVHRNGRSLAKSVALRETLLQSQSGKASVLIYQDPSQTLSAMSAQLPAELRNLIPANAGILTKPTIFFVDAEESSFRASANSSVPADASVALIVAAVAIPNLLRARVQATDAAAVSAIRVVNTAEVTYISSYPDKGYAPNLAILGPGGANCSVAGNVSADHACLLNETLGGSSCTAGKWCEKDGYKFSVRGVCMQGQCPNYVVTAIPAGSSTGARSYCSTSDLIVRTQTGAVPDSPLTVIECKKWSPVK